MLRLTCSKKFASAVAWKKRRAQLKRIGTLRVYPLFVFPVAILFHLKMEKFHIAITFMF